MSIKSVNRFQTRVRSQFNQNLTNSGINLPAGIYLGEVTQNVDPDYPNTNPRIKVHIFSLFPSIYPQNQGSTATGEPELGSIWCQRILPFGGITAQGGDTATSFGVLGPPPDVGNTVIVGYTGDYASGIILGVLPDLQKQESVTTGGPSSVNNEGIGPSFEPTRTGDRTARPIVSGSAEDLLQDDTLRGRPRPNGFNMGMSDRTGNTLTLSPGDSEDGTGGGVRLRTAQGSQIMMDDRTGNIYINNRSGTGWMELNNNGDFDVYCQGTFSVRAVGGFNFHTDNNFSAQADESINLKSLGGGGVKIQAAGGNIDMDSLNDLKITAQGGELHVNTGGNILLTSRAQIHLNGPTADRAEPPIVANQLGNTGVTESISGRVPEQEPWRGHADFSPDADAFSGSGGTGGNYSTYGGNGVDPSRVGNQYASLTQTPSDWVFWQDGVDGRINPELFSAIENIARGYGKAFEITKGYIEPSRAGGTSPADNSMHMTGDAVDIVHAQGSPEMTIAMIETIIELAKENGIGGIGVYNGRRPDAPFANKLHFDLGRERIWGECDNGSLQYECLPDAIQDYAEEQGYDPEAPIEDAGIDITEPPAGSSLSDEERKLLSPQEQRAIEIYRAFRQAGFSHNQSVALTGEVHRENAFREQFMYGTHSDPYNNATNVGIISWQGDRRTRMLSYLGSRGRIGSDGNIIPGYETLVTQAEFVKYEMENDASYSRTNSQFINSPNINLSDAKEVLGRNYIRWRYDDPVYQSDGFFNINSGINYLDNGLNKISDV